MTRAGRRLIEDFLLPALDDRRYGDRLQWVDKSNQYFSIRWNHKNAAKWTLEDTVVFQDWDKMKGHYHPDIKGYYMQAKQRFRAALYKLSTVRKVCSQDKHVKVYQLVSALDKRRTNSPAPQQKVISERGIPTSVICQNANYVPKSDDCWQDRTVSVKEEDSEHSNSISSQDSSMHSNEASNDSLVLPPSDDHEFDVKIEEKISSETKCLGNQRHVRAPLMPSYVPERRRVYATPTSSTVQYRWEPYWSQTGHEMVTCYRQVPIQSEEGSNAQQPNTAAATQRDEHEEALNLTTKRKRYENSYIPVSAR